MWQLNDARSSILGGVLKRSIKAEWLDFLLVVQQIGETPPDTI